MNSRNLLASLFTSVMGLLMVAGPAYGQVPSSTPLCSEGITPLQTLIGSWSYTQQKRDGAAAGIFTASIGVRGGRPTGILTITNSLNQNGSITRLETDAGTYQVFDDCSGGTLTFNLSSQPVAYDFWFVQKYVDKASPKLYMVSITGDPVVAEATRVDDPPSLGSIADLKIVSGPPTTVSTGFCRFIGGVPNASFFIRNDGDAAVGGVTSDVSWIGGGTVQTVTIPSPAAVLGPVGSVTPPSQIGPFNVPLTGCLFSPDCTALIQLRKSPRVPARGNFKAWVTCSAP